ncbi:MAG: GGDEF domain-containing protein [Novosphingobium sp.]
MTTNSFIPRLGRWLGIADQPPEALPTSESRPRDARAVDPLRLAAQQSLGDISEFIFQHRLPVDNQTLAAAFDYVSGQNRGFVELVNRRLADGELVTAEWLDQALGQASRDESSAMTDMMARLQRSIGDFTKTTREARSATTDYRTALRSHVDELGEASKAGAMIAELAGVAKAMIERTQDIEQQMVRSERETKTLQRRLDEARRNAEMDHLTGLPNRRAFETVLAQQYEEARANRDTLCVAFCDIDKFKLINDTHGHEAGDRVLKVVAKCLAEISGERCHVARHGGEEFVVLFRGKSLDEAFATLDETREALAGRRLVNRANDTPFGRVSFSAGLADVLAHRDPRLALRAADEALYAAKQQGRNRIVMATERPAESKAA